MEAADCRLRPQWVFLPIDLIRGKILELLSSQDSSSLLSSNRTLWSSQNLWRALVERWFHEDFEFFSSHEKSATTGDSGDWRDWFFSLRGMTRVLVVTQHAHGWTRIWTVALKNGKLEMVWKEIDAYYEAIESFAFRERAIVLDGGSTGPFRDSSCRLELWKWLRGPHGRKMACQYCGAVEGDAASKLRCNGENTGEQRPRIGHSGDIEILWYWDGAWEQTMPEGIKVPSDASGWKALDSDCWSTCCYVTWSCCGESVLSISGCPFAHGWRRCLHGRGVLEVMSVNVNAKCRQGKPMWNT